jgi:hypothetical protein
MQLEIVKPPVVRLLGWGQAAAAQAAANLQQLLLRL